MPPQRILVAKLAGLGDLLTITPALRALRDTFPAAHIAVLATGPSAVLLDGNAAVDRVIPFDKFLFDRPAAATRFLPDALALARRLRGEHFDTLVLLHHLTTRWGTAKYAALALGSGARARIGLDNGRGWFLTRRARDGGFGVLHEVDYWLRVVGLLGARNPRPRLLLYPSAADRAGADRHWAELGLGGADVVAIHPGCGSFSPARRWFPERFAAVADLLRERLGLRPVILAGPTADEPALARQVADLTRGGADVGLMRGRPQQTAAFLGRCRLFVGNDSGVMHLAVSAQTPTVAVFGPSNDRAWGPYPPGDPRFAVVRERLACSPCIHVGHSFGTPQGCPARTCLDLISPGRVFAAAERVLAAAPMFGVAG